MSEQFELTTWAFATALDGWPEIQVQLKASIQRRAEKVAADASERDGTRYKAVEIQNTDSALSWPGLEELNIAWEFIGEGKFKGTVRYCLEPE